MEYEATAKYIRVSTRKVRLVADAIRPVSVDSALRQLSVTPKAAGQPLEKAIRSAIANAVNANVKDVNALRFVRIEVSQGPVMKRWRAVSKGSAHTYKKRMTHIRIVLTDAEKK